MLPRARITEKLNRAANAKWCVAQSTSISVSFTWEVLAYLWSLLFVSEKEKDGGHEVLYFKSKASVKRS